MQRCLSEVISFVVVFFNLINYKLKKGITMIIEVLKQNGTVGIRVELNIFQLQELAGLSQTLSDYIPKINWDDPKNKRISDIRKSNKYAEDFRKLIQTDDKQVKLLETIEHVGMFLAKLSKDTPSRKDVLESLTTTREKDVLDKLESP